MTKGTGSKKLLIVGGGGREHALAWTLSKSDEVSQIYCAPGNGGTAYCDKTKNLAIDSMAFDQLSEFCTKEKIDLAVIGPDNPLAEGIVDHFTKKGIKTFGPTKEQAKLEWSKVHAKRFMTANGIPTAKYLTCQSLDEGKHLVSQNTWARIVKVDGLALGKGVFVCDTEAEVVAALEEIFLDGRFGEAGKTVLLEEKLVGEELSLLLLCDGKSLLPLAASQDHKRRFDGEKGPNTGGMGAYSPVPLYNAYDRTIEDRVLEPIRKALKNGRLSFVGVLYAGIMIAEQERGKHAPMVLEFNARFGDPETQAILPRLKSDLLGALEACTNGTLSKVNLDWHSEASCCVVAVTKDYPEKSAKGDAITIGALPEKSVAFHSGTKVEESKLMTAGGRIISVTGLGASAEEARSLAYQGLDQIEFDQIDFRKDIARERSKCL
jgi:phosphoribosylamine--glycine ligase